MNNNSLAHFGVLGMRWGVRRSQAQLGRRTSRSEEHTRSRELKQQPISTLTNAEIKALNERLNLEQNLSRMNPSTYQKGKNIGKAILATGTTITTVYTFVNSPAGKAIGAAIKKGARPDRPFL